MLSEKKHFQYSLSSVTIIFVVTLVISRLSIRFAAIFSATGKLFSPSQHREIGSATKSLRVEVSMDEERTRLRSMDFPRRSRRRVIYPFGSFDRENEEPLRHGMSQTPISHDLYVFAVAKRRVAAARLFDENVYLRNSNVLHANFHPPLPLISLSAQ